MVIERRACSVGMWDFGLWKCGECDDVFGAGVAVMAGEARRQLNSGGGTGPRSRLRCETFWEPHPLLPIQFLQK